MDIANQGSLTSSGRSGHPAVLIVEDNEDARFEVASVLRGHGYAVTEASDGEEGLRVLREHAIDLILLDLRLPSMDGWAFRVEQRAEKALSGIPVVVMTADKSAQARAIDADAILQKPFRAESLTRTIRQVLADRSLQMKGSADLVSEALTLLASAMGHEVGNALMGLIYTIEGARKDAMQGSSAEQDLGRMLDDCRRIRHSLRTLRQLPCPQWSRESDIDLHQVVRAGIARVNEEGGVRIAFDGDETAGVRGDPAVVRYVCNALLQNAVEAVPRAQNGVREGNSQRPDVNVRLRGAGGEVILDVCDFGARIPEAELVKLFSAYAPGRERAWAAGVRLWFARHAIEVLGGSIAISNLEEGGVRCRVRLPGSNQAE